MAAVGIAVTTAAVGIAVTAAAVGIAVAVAVVGTAVAAGIAAVAAVDRMARGRPSSVRPPLGFAFSMHNTASLVSCT